MTKPELGILGGSFDPPHIAHVMLALYGLSVGALERVLVAPTYIHAFGKSLEPFDHRLRMCELAFAPLQRVEVTPIERELGGVSRTLRLIETLQARYPHHGLRLLVGSDILAQRDRWQQFDRIAQLAPPLIAARVGHAEPGQSSPQILPELSSTEIRAALGNGSGTDGLLPAAVAAYIQTHSLYRERT